MTALARRRYILVVAHPDDEVLWFSSVVMQADAVICVFLADPARLSMAERRRRALAELPYTVEALGVDEAGTFDAVDWSQPEPSKFGLKLNAAGTQHVTQDAYSENFACVRSHIARRIPKGATVYTHAPWGEYGHPDHVQVFRVLESLLPEMDLTLMCPLYAAQRSASLLRQYAMPRHEDAEHLHCNRAIAEAAKRTYQKNACWTWHEDWSCPPSDAFVRAPMLFGGGVPIAELDRLVWVPDPTFPPYGASLTG